LGDSQPDLVYSYILFTKYYQTNFVQVEKEIKKELSMLRKCFIFFISISLFFNIIFVEKSFSGAMNNDGIGLKAYPWEGRIQIL